MSVVALEEIRRSFWRKEAVLAGVTLHAEPGEVVGLLGRNGAGKTTLLRIACGIIAPHAGSVRLFGQDPRVHPVEVKRRLGYVSENQILPRHLRVDEVVAMHRELFPTWSAELETRLRERFSVHGTSRIGTLSKGEARQVAVLCAVAHRPELLIMDEPAGGLDPAARRGFLEVAIDLLSDEGTTILFSSHYMSDVERIAQRVVMLDHGVVLIDSDLDALRQGWSLAQLGGTAGRDGAWLRGEEGFVRMRRVGDELHAVFARSAAELDGVLGARLPEASFTCRGVPLEELFIELVEGGP